MTTTPDDEIKATAARNIATRAKAKMEANRVVRDATQTAGAKAIAEANKSMERADKTFEGLQSEYAAADAKAKGLEADVAKRQKHDAEQEGGLNGILGRHYAGQADAAMKPAHYAATINERNAAIRRMVG